MNLTQLTDCYCKLRDALANIELTPGPPGPPGADGMDGADGEDAVGIVRTIYSEEYFAKTVNGTTQTNSRNMTITRTAAGRWNVVLNPAHPDGVNYHPSITAEEQSGNRDTPDITVVQGTQLAGGFSIQITTGDNGGAADVYVDTPFTIGIDSPVIVLVPGPQVIP